MDQQICGLTFEQYVAFHYDFVQMQEKRGRDEISFDELCGFLRSHGQEPLLDSEGELDFDYYMCGGLKPWEEVINASPELLGKKTMMYLALLNRSTHGDASESAEVVEIEGVTLDTYARVVALIHASGGKDHDRIYAENGIRDPAHFEAVNTGYTAAMSTDTTGRLAAHYGELFMKYQPQHAAAVNAFVGDTLAAEAARIKAVDERNAKAEQTIYEMAHRGNAQAIADYVKETITDAEEADELDYYLERVGERLAADKRWDALKVLLQARFITLDPGGDMDEWVQDEFDGLYSEDED